jgi:hypothetical protein
MNDPVKKDFNPTGTKSEYQVVKVVVRFYADEASTPTFSWTSYKCGYSRSFYKGKEELGTQEYEYGVSLTPYGVPIENTHSVKSGPNTIVKMTPAEAEESVEFNHIKILKDIDLLFENVSQIRKYVQYKNEKGGKEYNSEQFRKEFSSPKYTMETKDGRMINPVTEEEKKENVVVKESAIQKITPRDPRLPLSKRPPKTITPETVYQRHKNPKDTPGEEEDIMEELGERFKGIVKHAMEQLGTGHYDEHGVWTDGFSEVRELYEEQHKKQKPEAKVTKAFLSAKEKIDMSPADVDYSWNGLEVVLEEGKKYPDKKL